MTPGVAWHETISSNDVDGAILHAPVGAPAGPHGTFAMAASRAPGVTAFMHGAVCTGVDK